MPGTVEYWTDHDAEKPAGREIEFETADDVEQMWLDSVYLNDELVFPPAPPRPKIRFKRPKKKNNGYRSPFEGPPPALPDRNEDDDRPLPPMQRTDFSHVEFSSIQSLARAVVQQWMLGAARNPDEAELELDRGCLDLWLLCLGDLMFMHEACHRFLEDVRAGRINRIGKRTDQGDARPFWPVERRAANR